jgi:hypothetical protein
MEDSIMSNKNFGSVIIRPDGSFVIERNGLPYHVPDNEEFAELWAEVFVYAEAHPDRVTPEPPPEPPTTEEQEAVRQAEITG